MITKFTKHVKYPFYVLWPYFQAIQPRVASIPSKYPNFILVYRKYTNFKGLIFELVFLFAQNNLMIKFQSKSTSKLKVIVKDQKFIAHVYWLDFPHLQFCFSYFGSFTITFNIVVDFDQNLIIRLLSTLRWPCKIQYS